MEIRRMQLNDLESIKDILQSDFDDFWSYNVFADELQNQYSTYFCAVTKYIEKSIEHKSNACAETNIDVKNNINAENYVTENNDIVGFAGVWQSIDVMHITNIVVRKDMRGKHIGAKLLEELIEFAKNTTEVIALTLEVHEDNIVAKKLYEKYDFKPEGIRKRYYKDNKNAIILTLKFNK